MHDIKKSAINMKKHLLGDIKSMADELAIAWENKKEKNYLTKYLATI